MVIIKEMTTDSNTAASFTPERNKPLRIPPSKPPKAIRNKIARDAIKQINETDIS
jgi:hypothetical protein